MVPQIPQHNSRQFKTLVHLLNEWTRVWVIDVPGVSHKHLIADVAHLRKKGWPIEDDVVENYHSPRAYRIDPERWQALKWKFDEEFWRI